MTDEPVPTDSGKIEGSVETYQVGKGKPPIDTRFGGKRANPRGRKPKSFDQLRALAQKISHEPIADSSQITVAEAILRTMAKENPARFVEIAFGKVPDEVNASGQIKHVITIEYIDADTTSAPARSAADDQATGEAL